MCKDRSQAHAFTLIELLVVVAVIALLLGILVPALAATKQAAETTKATVAARSLMQAYLMYAAEHKDEVLPAYLSPQDATTGVYDEFGNPLVPPVSQRWVYRLGPYFDYGWAGTTHIGTGLVAVGLFLFQRRLDRLRLVEGLELIVEDGRRTLCRLFGSVGGRLGPRSVRIGRR